MGVISPRISFCTGKSFLPVGCADDTGSAVGKPEDAAVVAVGAAGGIAVADEPHATAAIAINMTRRETIDLGLGITANKIGYLHALIVGSGKVVPVLQTWELRA